MLFTPTRGAFVRGDEPPHYTFKVKCVTTRQPFIVG